MKSFNHQPAWTGTAARVSIILLCLITFSNIHAQNLEPRAYANAPVGMNFLFAGYQNSTGALLFDPSIPVADANARVDLGFLGYVRTLGIQGKSTKVGVLLPYAELSASGFVNGVYTTRDQQGPADPVLYFTINLMGAPAMSLKDFRNYRQDMIIGLTFEVSPPLGVYDPDRVINIGTNRWTFTPGIGISQAVGRWIFEGSGTVHLYTDNTDFDNGKRRAQDPIYAVQAHAIYVFSSQTWVSLSTTYYTGGKTSVDGVSGNDLQNNWRTGFTIALPVNSDHSVKIFGSTGVSTRTGTDYDSLGIAWQYRWGGGV